MIRSILKRVLVVAAAPALLLSPGCDQAAEDGMLEEPGASFGIGKADGDAGGFTACELREVLEIVNESTTTVDVLRSEVGLHSRAADGIIAHRLGADGVQGTGDDDIFDDLAELDGVLYVGPVTLEALASFGEVRCRVTLDRPYMDQTTFAGATGGGWTRDSVELEATMTLSGMTGQMLRAILAGRDERDRTGFQSIRKSKAMEALSVGFDLQEIPWSRKAHEVRQTMPFTAWTIESDRFSYDEGDGERELSLGTDKMDDTYYDTVDFRLLEAGMQVRGRIRWDTDDTVRRLLIAAKLDSEVDADGLKRAAKVDVRTEGGDDVATLDNDVRSGTVPWGYGGSATAIEPLHVVYKSLDERGMLQTEGNRDDLLLLDPKVHIRSVRSRYHLDFASVGEMKTVHANGRARVQATVAFAQAQLDAGVFADDQDAADEVTALITMGTGILDGSAIVDAARANLEGLGLSAGEIAEVARFDGWSSSAPGVSDLKALGSWEAVAGATDQVMDAYAELLDEVDRDLSQTRGLDGKDWAEQFIAWQKSVDAGLRKYTVPTPFIAAYEGLAAADAAARTQQIDAFNAYGAAQMDAGEKGFKGFEVMDDDGFVALGKHLKFEELKVDQRMIEAGGTITMAMYWELCREFFVPASYRTGSNMIIDTIDFTEMLTHEEWSGIPEDQRKPSDVLPADKIFHSTLVNEVQLELTEVAHYLDAIESFGAELAANPDDGELEMKLQGARWTFGILEQSITTIAALKEDGLLGDLEELGAPNTTSWIPASYSKGKTALLILTDKL